ncbi:hypothetical protein HDU78_008965 [Chytriomyces hyalinus]|nr:hypothetical protein HDU78_008965 [Chytriomyces hyalinus]KAJ3265323.1 hypothetical protein HDU77_005566 [Chytriomyces hyalinus]
MALVGRMMLVSQRRQASTYFAGGAGGGSNGTGASSGRGGRGASAVLGFVVGASVTGFAAYTSLVDQYRASSSAVLASIDSLQDAVKKLQRHTQKMDTLEKDLKAVAAKSASNQSVESLRNELLKVTDEITIAHLELKASFTDLANDIRRK